MGENDKIKESKRKACKDAIDRTSNGLKGLISPFKTFKRGREDPVLASLENLFLACFDLCRGENGSLGFPRRYDRPDVRGTPGHRLVR